MASNRRGTLIDIITQSVMEIGIAQQPVKTVIGSRDQDIVQMKALLEAVASELLDEEPYRTQLGDGLWIIDDASGRYIEKFAADSDQIAFDKRLAIQGIIWRFLKAKGLEFSEQLRDFTGHLNKLAARANGRVLDIYEDEDRVQ